MDREEGGLRVVIRVDIPTVIYPSVIVDGTSIECFPASIVIGLSRSHVSLSHRGKRLTMCIKIPLI
jgi:hypothetical protein